jgi:hypothetical protein
MAKSHGDDTDRAGRLFATLTGRLEDAHELAVEGQNPRASALDRKKLLRKLDRRLARCHVAIAEIDEVLGR